MTTLSKEADNAYDASMQVPGSLSLDALYKIQRSCVYITKNCSEDLSLNDVASMAGFSPNYFSRMFKETTGYNFVEYLMIERVRKAQRYLGDNSIPITEVAYLSGFKSISTFNRVFHQIKNCSPRQFRKYMVTV
jgi:AraC-like DNA-binding protein